MVVAGAGLVAASWAFASPAGAHAGFVGTSSVPVDAPAELVMRVPHERGASVYNVEIQVALPEGWTPLTCATKDTWTCALTTTSGRAVVRFTKADGAARAEDERFTFTARSAREAGTASFPVTQRYNTGEVVRWIDGPGSAEPAATLRLTGTAAPTTAAPATTAGAPTTGATATTGTPATTRAAATTATPATTTSAALSPPASAPTTEDGDGSSSAPVIVGGIVAAAIAGGAAAWRTKVRRGKAG
jgi:uncharacterized protein YcnI